MKLLKRTLYAFLALVLLLIVVFLSGPKMDFAAVTNSPLPGTYTIEEAEEIISTRNQNELIKDNNEEKIVWFDGKEKTEYAFVYVHGFSASHGEGAPLHMNMANRYGANLFLTRLPEHGLTDEDSFIELTPESLVEYAKEAVKIGKSIGNKVVLISCSTGGTLSAYLAAADPDIDALIMFSPNFEMYSQSTKVLTKPWGLNIARQIKGGLYHEWNTPQIARPYWYHKYRLEGVAALQSLVEQSATTAIFSKIEQPVFIGYYYQDEDHQDFTISTEKIKEFAATIATPNSEKVVKAYPNGKAHVFISPYFNDEWADAQQDAFSFLEEVLEMKPVMAAVLPN